MNEKNTPKKEDNSIKSDIRMADLIPTDKQKLVAAFAWLLEEDRKQNPALYQLKTH